MKAKKGRRGIALNFNLGARWGLGSQGNAPAALSPGKRPGTHCQRLDRPKGRAEHVRNLSPTGIRSPDSPARKESLSRTTVCTVLPLNYTDLKMEVPRFSETSEDVLTNNKTRKAKLSSLQSMSPWDWDDIRGPTV
jgi:hypothetical protein